MLYFHCIIWLVVVEGAGRGAIAREHLKVGDIALEIPVTVIISEELVRESDMVHFILKESCYFTNHNNLNLSS